MKKLFFTLIATCLLLVGCSSKTAKDVDLNALSLEIQNLESVKDITFFEMDEVTTNDFFSMIELNVESVESAAVLKPMINVIAFEVIMIEAKDGKIDEVKTAVDAYIQFQVDGGAFYPANIEAYKNCVKYENGNYYIVVVGEQHAEIMAVVEAAFK